MRNSKVLNGFDKSNRNIVDKLFINIQKNIVGLILRIDVENSKTFEFDLKLNKKLRLHTLNIFYANFDFVLFIRKIVTSVNLSNSWSISSCT